MNSLFATASRSIFILSALLTISCSSGEKSRTQEAAMSSAKPTSPAANLSEKEAIRRATQVSEIQYAIALDIAASRTEFHGTTLISFKTANTSENLRVDFYDGTVKSVKIDGLSLPVTGAESVYNGQFITIASRYLRTGRQNIEVEFSHPYNRNGRGLSTFTDPLDSKVYLSTQFEAFDANQMFPCFDQPDLKATYEISVTAPTDWKVVTSTRETRIEKKSDTTSRWTFARSAKFSTYIMSLHAGPFMMWEEKTAFRVPLRLFARQSIAKNVDPKDWFPATRHGFDFFEKYFSTRYPYLKYDQLLIPEFNSGAMENVGAVTFSERFVTRGKKSRTQLRGLHSTILHELAHMWFGNLVTMKWWGDLWLNESFATYMANVAVAEMKDHPDAWNASAASKEWTYQEDQMPTTHPIVAEVDDTDEAFTSFDGITYGKGAAVLKQLSYYIGEKNFKKGLAVYFAKNAGKNTLYTDFLSAMSTASGRDLTQWSKDWLQTAGLSSVLAQPVCENGRLQSIQFTQGNVSGDTVIRGHAMEIAMIQANGTHSTLKVELTAANQAVPVKTPTACPAIVYPNNRDYGYFKTAIPTDSSNALLQSLSTTKDTLLRQQLWTTTWTLVRDAKLDFVSYSAALESGLRTETSEILIRHLFGAISSLQVYYWNSQTLTPEVKTAFLERVDKILWSRLEKTEKDTTDRLLWISGLNLMASQWGQEKLVNALNEEGPIALDQDRRWEAVIRLAQLGASAARAIIEREAARDPSSAGIDRKIAAIAALPDWESKMQWVAEYKKKPSTYSFAQLRSAFSNLFPASQHDLRAKFASEFFTDLRWVNKNRDNSEAGLFTALAPFECAPLASSKSDVNTIETFLRNENGLQPVISKRLKQQNDESARCRKILAFQGSRGA